MISLDDFKKDFIKTLRDSGFKQDVEVIETVNENTNQVIILRVIQDEAEDAYLVFNNWENFDDYPSWNKEVKNQFLKHTLGMLRAKLLVRNASC